MVADYSLGKIYKIVNRVNNIVYIGSTCQKYLSHRMNCHRAFAKDLDRGNSKLYKSMREIHPDEFTIVLVKTYSCASREKLEKMETRVIQRYLREGIELYNTVINGGKGSDAGHFKRGSICFDHKGIYLYWSFQWTENKIRKSKTFSIKKYGDQGAKDLALALQNEIYPS